MCSSDIHFGSFISLRSHPKTPSSIRIVLLSPGRESLRPTLSSERLKLASSEMSLLDCQSHWIPGIVPGSRMKVDFFSSPAMLVMAVPLKPQWALMHRLFPLMMTINMNELGAVVIVVHRDVHGVGRWQQGAAEHHEI